jgi:predicted nucleic acid-binding protein
VAPFTALYDANVLYPAELRNFLMHLALTGLYRAKWSADIHEEWMSNLLKNRPDLTRAKLERTRSLMDQHALDALVTGYEDLIPKLKLPDPKDRHVLAAAIQGRANVIVTMNRRHFPAEIIAPLGLEAQHPDAFILRLIDLSPVGVLTAARRRRSPFRKIRRFFAYFFVIFFNNSTAFRMSVSRFWMSGSSRSIVKTPRYPISFSF